MKIELSLTPALYQYRTITARHTTVAIDLLRATTAICAAFQAGCKAIIPLDTLDGISRYRELGYLIAAERNGSKVGDAEYGNSPTEYLKNDLTGVKLAYSTTNGTVSILRATDADKVLVGSFANIGALCDQLRKDDQDVVILCSGWKNDFCIEDTLVAGAIIERLAECASPWGDAAHMAVEMWRQAKGNPYVYCQRCSHVARLRRLDAEADVEFAFRQDTCPVVPQYRDGLLICE